MKKIFLIAILISVSISAQKSVPLSFSLEKSSAQEFQSNLPASNSIEDITVAGDTVVLATGKGVSISIDNGVTWNNLEDNEVFADDYVSRVAIYKGIIWAGLWHYEDGPDGKVATGGGLAYSSDLGENWTHIEQPLDDSLSNTVQYGNNTLRALAITVPQQNLVYGIGLTSDAVWIASWSAGIRKSTDMGQTWQRVVLPPDNLDEVHPEGTYNFNISPVPKENFDESLNYIGRSVLAINDSTIICGTAGGVNISTDYGISWRKYNHTNQSNPISGNHIWNIKYNKYDNSLWLCSWRAQDSNEINASSRSTDLGNSWTTYLHDVRVYDVDFRNYFVDGVYSRSDIIAASDEGVFRSTDDGDSWILAPDIYDRNKEIEVKNKEMHATAVTQQTSGTATLFIGSQGGGLIKMIESENAWDGDWEVFFVSGEDVSESNSSFAFPNPFSPIQREVNIKYSLKQPADVTIRILDFGMNLVKTIIQNAPRSANDVRIEHWDGRDESGSYVSNGVYFYRIDAGSNEPLFGKILVVK